MHLHSIRMLLSFLILAFVVVQTKSCDSGWQRFNNKCYKYIQTKVSYKSAIQLCNNYNATLASVHSREEHVFIEEVARHYSTVSGVHWVWLGGQRVKNKSSEFTVDNMNNQSAYQTSVPDFEWQDGSPFNYSEWRSNCPDKRRDEDCILMSVFQSRPSHWCNYKCENNQDHVLCQKVMKPDSELAIAVNSTKDDKNQTNEIVLGEGSCEIGWQYDGNNHCYKYFETNLTWAAANSLCVQNNANLLSINSEAEQMFIQNYVFAISNSLEAVWLGAKRDLVSKEFKWSDSSSFDYQNYAPHEPDFRNKKENCLAMNNVDDFLGLWLDAPCSVLFSVTCKKKAKHVPGCSSAANLEIINEAQRAFQMNDFIVQLLQKITNKLDEQFNNKQQLIYPKDVGENSADDSRAIAMQIKSELDSVVNNSSLIRLSLHLSVFISMVLICIIMCLLVFVFRRRHLLKKPYMSIFSFKNLNYDEKNLTNGNEYEELLYGQNNGNLHSSILLNNSNTNQTRQLSDKV